jgi:hypothetical protein
MAGLKTAVRHLTDNQATFDRTYVPLVLGEIRTIDKPYKNVSGAIEDVALGQVMGVIAATGKWTVCKSAAIDGSAVPRGVINQELVDMPIGQELDSIPIINFGDLDRAELVFNGTDTLDTLVGGIRMEDLLIANSQGIKLRTASDASSLAN